VGLYQVSRKRGIPSSAFPYVNPTPTSTTTATSFIDVEQLPDGVQFSYRSRAEYDDQNPHIFSPFSKPVTITAVNNAPVAIADSYTATKGKALNVATQAAGVLGNDSDVDSPASFMKAVLVSGPSNGTLILNANGSFTYDPRNGFTGVDTFRYKANNGFWSADPTVPMNTVDSATVVVTITVTK
jgi:VCBS repeat-containing protein